MIQAHGLRTSQGCGRPRHVSAPEPCAPRHTPRRRDAANSLSSSTVPPLAFLRAGARVSSTEPRPHQDCDKPDKPCRRHRRETPVYRIKIKRFHSAGAANTVQHLSSPETRRCFPPTMARTIAMLRPLCFAKWDKIFYFSGQQWLGVPDRFTNCRVRDGDRHGGAGIALFGAVDVDCDVDRGASRAKIEFRPRTKPMNDEGHSVTERQALCNATLVGGGTVGGCRARPAARPALTKLCLSEQP